MEVKDLTHLDLFSGIGGFALAAKWCGIRTIQFVELDPFCQKVLQKNFPGVPIHDNIKTFTHTSNESWRELPSQGIQHKRPTSNELQPSDAYCQGVIRRSGKVCPSILTGGFPCQPYSCAGKRRGKEDHRALWPEMLRVVSEAKPRWIIGENVAGFINMGLDDCISDLENQGYEVQAFVIPACAVNAPHRRDRVWIVGNSTGSTERKIGRICEGESSNSARGIEQDCHAPDTESRKNNQRNGRSLDTPEECGKCSDSAVSTGDKYVSNSQGERLEGSIKTDREQGQKSNDKQLHGCRGEWDEPWIEAATRLCRVDARIPNRVDRLKSLGNAIVPQVAYQIMKAIKGTL